MSEEIFSCPGGLSTLQGAMHNVTIATIDDRNRDTKCRRNVRRQHFARNVRSCSTTMSHRAGVANHPSEKKDLFFQTTFDPSRMVSDEVGRSSSRNVSISDRDLCLVDSVGLACEIYSLFLLCDIKEEPLRGAHCMEPIAWSPLHGAHCMEP